MSCNCTNNCNCGDPCSDTQIRRIVDDAVADRVEDMEGIASDAQGSATASANSANQSAQSATQSQQFATTAGNNATSAAQSAQQAAVSATAAAESATAAVQVTTGLKQVADELTATASGLSSKVDQANQNAELAETARDEAVAAASSAQNSAATSTASASAANVAASAAATSSDTAQTAAGQAGEYAVQAAELVSNLDTKIDTAVSTALDNATEDVINAATEQATSAANSASAAASSLETMSSTLAAATTNAVAQATEDAEAARDAAELARDQANAIATSVGLVPDEATGLANTTEGQYFTVGQGTESDAATITYRNVGGVAVPVFTSVGTAAFTKLSTKFLNLVTQVEYGNAVAGFIDDANMSPLFINPEGYVIINNLNFLEQVQSLLNKIDAFYNFFSTYSSDDYEQKGGFIDDEGKLPLYFDQYGDVWLGDGPVNLSQFVRDYSALVTKVDNVAYEINGSGNIICDGDSLTAGAGSATGRGYVERLRTRLAPQGITVTKRAVGGQGAQSIATRQGGYVNLLTLENNILPAAIQPVNIVSSTQTPITNQGGGPISGKLNGIRGTVAATFNGTTRLTYTFTRAEAGTADVYIDPESPFIKTEDGHEYDIDIIWLGRNNTSSPDLAQICLDALDACVKHLKAKNKRFVVMSILNGAYSTEYKGGEVYQRIINANNAIKYKYPENYLEVRGPLVRSYNPSVPQDVVDFNNDIVPSSLRNDAIHLNDSGYDILEELVYNFLKSKGWVA